VRTPAMLIATPTASPAHSAQPRVGSSFPKN
jgi:hypothetical protein